MTADYADSDDEDEVEVEVATGTTGGKAVAQGFAAAAEFAAAAVAAETVTYQVAATITSRCASDAYIAAEAAL